MKRNSQTSILRQGEAAIIDAGVWHDWWNVSPRDARVRGSQHAAWRSHRSADDVSASARPALATQPICLRYSESGRYQVL